MFFHFGYFRKAWLKCQTGQLCVWFMTCLINSTEFVLDFVDLNLTSYELPVVFVVGLFDVG